MDETSLLTWFVYGLGSGVGFALTSWLVGKLT